MNRTPAASVSRSWRSSVRPRRWWRFAVLLTVLAVIWAGEAESASTGGGVSQTAPGKAVITRVLRVPPGMNPSEPHLAVDPEHPQRLFAVAQGPIPAVSAQLTPGALWRSRDGGRTWSRPALMGFIDNGPDGFAGDPVVAAGRDGLVLFGRLAFQVDEAAGTFTEHVGTGVSTDGGRTFPAFGSVDRLVLPLCVFDTCGPPPPFLDKEWIAVDATDGAFGGSAYIAWLRPHPDGTRDLLFARSRNGGRRYSAPLLLQRSTAEELAGYSEHVQLAVRPGGTVDAVWNGVRGGRPHILHAVSRNGGVSFSRPEPVVRLAPRAGQVDVITSLAVSPHGRLAVCWPQARPVAPFTSQIACTATDRKGRWRAQGLVLPGNRDRQYLPAATFQGERLWVAAYVSDATATRVVAVPHGKHGGFGPAVTLNRWPVPSDRICAPHPPACTQGQTFIGDYIGAVATRKRIAVAYIEPVVTPGRHNRVLVSVLS